MIHLSMEQKPISVFDFIAICSTSTMLKKDTYCVILHCGSSEYYCTIQCYPTYVEIYFDSTATCHSIPMLALSKDTTTFLVVTIHYQGREFDSTGKQMYGTSSISTKPVFASCYDLPPLESIMYLRCCFYRMISISWYMITDSASGSCKSNDAESRLYLLFPYRIFARNKDKAFYPLSSLSIYYRFFTTIYDTIQRSINLQSPRLQSKLEEIRKITFDFGKGSVRLTSYFENFVPSIDQCPLLSKNINYADRVLTSTNELYSEFTSYLTSFIVTNEDCIYYPYVTKREKNASLDSSIDTILSGATNAAKGIKKKHRKSKNKAFSQKALLRSGRIPQNLL